MPNIELRPGRARIVFSLIAIGVALLVFVAIAAGALMGGTSPSYGAFAICLAMIAFWVWGLLRVLRRLRDPNAQVILDDEGVTDRTMPTPTFPWRSIVSARTMRTRQLGFALTTMVYLDLTDEQERLGRLSSKDRKLVAMNRSLGYGTFFVNLTSLPMSAEDFFRAMNERRARQGLPALIDGIRTAPFEETRPQST